MFTRALPPFLMLNGDPAPAGGGDPAPPAPAPTPEPSPTPKAEPAAPPAPAADPSDPKPPWTADDFDAERAWNRIQAQKADLDAERAKRDQAVKDAEAAATQRAREEAYREFGKQLGIVKDDEAPTVEGLQAALQERDTKISASDARVLALSVENAVLKYSDKHGADADALADSSSFTEKLKALDPTSDKYASEVEALVKSTVESNSRYRKVQVAPQSSNGNPAPSGDPLPSNDDTSYEALKRRRDDRRKNRL